MRGWLLLLCVGLMLLPQAAAAERCRAIGVVKEKDLQGHALSLSLVHGDGRVAKSGEGDSPALSIGAAVDLCFESSRDGFVSVWSHDADNNPPVRILPNDYLKAEDDEPGIPIRAGVPTCFSEIAKVQNIALQVGPPLGRAEIYLHFAESRDGQIGPGDFPTIGNRVLNTGDSCKTTPTDDTSGDPAQPYASRTLSYEVVE